MYEFQRLYDLSHSPLLSAYQKLTPATFVSKLVNPKQNSLICVGLLHHSQPVGLGIMTELPNKGAKLASLYIEREHRHKGLGEQLLAELENMLREESSNSHFMFVQYPSSLSSLTFFEKILWKQKWEKTGYLVFGRLASDVEINWIYKPFKKPAGF